MSGKAAEAILCLALAALLGPPADSADTPGAGIDARREVLRIRIVNEHEGEVAVSRDGGDSWETVGRVLRYTTRVNDRGFTASKWVPAGRVAAAAVNAIHISAGYNGKDDRGIVFSLLPREFGAPPPGYQSFLSPGSSIYTDIPAGDAIFGGGSAPFVGSRIFLATEAGMLSAVDDGYVPRRGDTLVIVVAQPSSYPVAATFENRPGGAVRLVFGDGRDEFLGWVIRPARGIGRFGGSLYAGIGRIRAAHAGVVDVATSPKGSLGGFQILPVGHALSPEMHRAWEMTQWMIVGPAADDADLWGSLMPLFYQHVRPDYHCDDLHAPDWEQRLLAHFLVDVDTGAGWQPMPLGRLAADSNQPLPDWAHHALVEVDRMRILFPLLAGSVSGRRGAAQ
jgi:hypothetical protein